MNMTLTLGVVLAEAYERGLRLDVETASGRVFRGVQVAALEQFCVVLLDDRAHVLARDHLAAVSLDRSAFLEIEPRTVDLREARMGDAAFAM